MKNAGVTTTSLLAFGFNLIAAKEEYSLLNNVENADNK